MAANVRCRSPARAGARARLPSVVPWRDVQAVVRRPQAGGWLVQLMLDSGKPVTLRAPMISWGFGGWPRTSRTITASSSGGSRTAARPGARCTNGETSG